MPVARSGRVWVYCDASDHPAELGELLPIAVQPGYATAVRVDSRVHGAVIGKAMARLRESKTG